MIMWLFRVDHPCNIHIILDLGEENHFKILIQNYVYLGLKTVKYDIIRI